MYLVHICSINSIVSGLRDLAISSSSRPRDDPKTKALVNAAKSGADAPLPELQSVISQVAVNIHGLYVLKSMGNPTLDPLRLQKINSLLILSVKLH